jgi:hypothetical protein
MGLSIVKLAHNELTQQQQQQQQQPSSSAAVNCRQAWWLVVPNYCFNCWLSALHCTDDA